MIAIERFRVGPRMSQAVRYGDLIYLAGQVADDREQDAVGQTLQILRKIESLLVESGSDKASVLTATVWLADMGDFEAMNSVWDAWVPQGSTPARACVESRLAKPEIKVEIGIVAARSCN